jgi:hypothetical protein
MDGESTGLCLYGDYLGSTTWVVTMVLVWDVSCISDIVLVNLASLHRVHSGSLG